MKIKEYLEGHPFVRNFSVLTIGQFCARAINMITNVILVRWLEPTGYGEYTFFLTFIAIFGVVASLGMNYIINRYVARNQEKSRKYLYICYLWRFNGFILAAVALLAYNYLREDGFSTFIIVSLLIGIALESYWAALQSVAFGMQHMEWNSLIEVISAVTIAVTYISIQLIDPSQLTVEFVIIIHLVIILLKNIFYRITLQSQNLITGHFTWNQISIKDLKLIILQGFPFYVLAMVGLFTNQFPIIFLEQNAGIEEVAYFNATNKLLLPLTILLSTALTALFPNQAKLFKTNEDLYWKHVEKMFLFLVVFGGAFSLFFSLFRNEMVVLLYGIKYVNTGNVMALQCWYIVLFALFSLNGNALGASDRQKILSYESIGFAIITTPIIYYTSHQGAEGLSMGYCMASVINMLFLYTILIKVSRNRLTITKILKMMVFLFIPILLSIFIPVNSNIIIRFFCVLSYMYLLFILYSKKYLIFLDK